jgi:hypothetical protein
VPVYEGNHKGKSEIQGLIKLQLYGGTAENKILYLGLARLSRLTSEKRGK